MKKLIYLVAVLFSFTSTLTAQFGTDTIEVSTGWNIIGALTTGSIPDIISTEPPGIIESSFFGYIPGAAYLSADTLKRGKGYWVKVNQNGIIIIGFGTILSCGTVDYGGKIYNTVIIGTQCWLRENLDIGTMIPGGQNQTNNGIIEKYCYNNDPNNCNIYGALYQWNEAMQYSTTPGTQGICPPGWHIPTYEELYTLASAVNYDSNSLKDIGQGTGNGTGTNVSGFTALLAGYCDFNGVFNFLGIYANFWSSKEYIDNTAAAWGMNMNNSTNHIGFHTGDKWNSESVRCIKD